MKRGDERRIATASPPQHTEGTFPVYTRATRTGENGKREGAVEYRTPARIVLVLRRGGTVSLLVNEAAKEDWSAFRVEGYSSPPLKPNILFFSLHVSALQHREEAAGATVVQSEASS